MGPHQAATRRGASQHGVLTRRQALACGLTSEEIRGHLEAGRWERIHQGVYRIAGSRPTLEQAMMAAVLAAGPGAALSHVSAATVHNLPAGGAGIHVTVPEARRRAISGVTVHRVARLDRTDWIVKHGLPVTTVARTIIDMAGGLRAERLEEILDHALAARLVSLYQIRYRLNALGTRGRAGAAVLSGLVATRLEGSPRPRERGERQLEQILAEHGLPLGEREYAIVLPDGRIRRPDRAYPEFGLAIQIDSYRHHSSLTDWAADLTRDNELVAIGWGTLVFTYRDLKRHPARVARVIEDTLRRRGATGAPSRSG